MSQEEINDCWMNDQDFKNIRLECRHAVQAFDNALKHTHLPEGYYLRGLDQQTMVSSYLTVRKPQSHIDPILLMPTSYLFIYVRNIKNVVMQ